MNLGTQYIAVLCLFPFVLGSVPSLENQVDSASVMNIGLGGGSIDMFLHKLKPTVSLENLSAIRFKNFSGKLMFMSWIRQLESLHTTGLASKTMPIEKPL